MHSDRPALETGAGVTTYAQLYRRARAAAGALRQREVCAGDRVALELSGEDLIVAVHGCLLIGAVAVPIDLRLPAGDRAQRALGAVSIVQAPLDGPGATPIEPALIRELSLAAPATIMHTSGSTAAPRPISLSYDNWLWNALGSALALGLDPHERWLCPMPLVHVGGLSIHLRSAIYGTTVRLHERFDTAAVASALMDP